MKFDDDDPQYKEAMEWAREVFERKIVFARYMRELDSVDEVEELERMYGDGPE